MRKTSKKNPLFFIFLGVLLLAVGLLSVFGGRIISCVRGIPLSLRYTDELKAAADRYGLDRRLVAAVVNTESGFDEKAVSRDGAEGLMQLLPSTAEWIAAMRGLEYEEGCLFDPETNLDYGCWLLRYLLDRYDGSVRYALIAYNAGHARLEEWIKTRADENGDIDIPYPETKNYVKKIEGLIERYGKVYEKELCD